MGWRVCVWMSEAVAVCVCVCVCVSARASPHVTPHPTTWDPVAAEPASPPRPEHSALGQEWPRTLGAGLALCLRVCGGCRYLGTVLTPKKALPHGGSQPATEGGHRRDLLRPLPLGERGRVSVCVSVRVSLCVARPAVAERISSRLIAHSSVSE